MVSILFCETFAFSDSKAKTQAVHKWVVPMCTTVCGQLVYAGYPALVTSPVVGLGAACGPHWCTLEQAIFLYWCTLCYCSCPLLVQELACTGVRLDLLVVTAGLGFQEEASGRPAGKGGGSSAGTLSVSNPTTPPLTTSPPCRHFHANLVELFLAFFLSLSFGRLI